MNLLEKKENFKMISAGIDIGSRTTAIAIIDAHSKKLLEYKVIDSTSFQDEPGTKIRTSSQDQAAVEISDRTIKKRDPISRAKELAGQFSYDFMVATGYGRHAANASFADNVITEIKAFAQGAFALFPDTRTILDIGGQDMKAIVLDGKGRVINFQMNEKCAAGTGRFLEIMASALGYSISDFGEIPFRALRDDLRISSMCTVFAESEVISLLHSGVEIESIVKAVHLSIAEKVLGLLRRIGAEDPIFFAGGVARNRFLREVIARKLKCEIFVPEEPQIVGAYGAALEAARYLTETKEEVKSAE